MAKKIVALTDYLSASDAAQLLSLKYDRPISPKYIRQISNRKKQPVRTQQIGNRLLYLREDIEAASIRKRERKHE